MNQKLVDALIQVIESLPPEEQHLLKSRLQETDPIHLSSGTKTVLDAEFVGENVELSEAVLQTNLPNRLGED
jgi:hypothetical protein